MSNFKTVLKRNLLWLFYGLFLVVALVNHSTSSDGASFFTSSGPYGLGKTLIWVIWLAFFIYSFKISLVEDFFKSLKRMHPILWHRQIGLDLYIGLLVPLFIIYLNEGSLLILLLWVLPIFVFANLATLIYLALNYDALIARFIS